MNQVEIEVSFGGREFVDQHLNVCLTGDGRWRRLADVLHLGLPGRGRGRSRVVAAHVAALALARHPGCAVAAVGTADGAVTVLCATGQSFVIRLPAEHSPGRNAFAIGSLTHAWLAAGAAAPGSGQVSRMSWSAAPGSPAIRSASRAASGARTDR
ncbi:hypothetical protein [Kitasatospora sp. McL0602]|uniref:hypothetical protein n=1 Tax=Kitasatospora sp. McL0602 TaxID=3439530 RepID=UPI003F89A453